ncbi:hypothetical protein HMPREF9713_00695 [Myroides odoratimimus CCUG 12700]|nr:hypothetical protein HMPREF9713_00695 [Myroides odoratimimus CCUG 12700]
MQSILFRLHPEINQLLWGGHLWTSGFYAKYNRLVWE